MRASQGLRQKAVERAAGRRRRRFTAAECLFRVNQLTRQADLSLEALYQGTLDAVVAASRDPAQTSARLRMGGVDFESEGFQETGWEYASPIEVDGVRMGEIQVFSHGPPLGRALSWPVDRRLVDAVAQTLGNAVKAAGDRAALLASEASLRKVIESDADGVLVVNDDGSILFANPAAYDLLGRAQDQLIGEQLGFPIVPHEWIEVNVVRPDGSFAIVEMRAVHSEWFRSPAYVVSLHDLTGQKLLEKERLEHLSRLQTMMFRTIQAMALTIEKRDPYTGGHQQRVARLAVAIGREMGLSAEEIEGLRLGASIHDIGKIHIPTETLIRPARLTEVEFELVKKHPAAGYEILKDMDFPWPIARMVLEHHERLDGSGYPRGLVGPQICREARVLAVADVVEAMASHRPHRPALRMADALEEIERGRGRLYDADAVDACLRLFRVKGHALDAGAA